MLSETTENFLKLNNVSKEELAKIDGTIFSQKNINPIINDFGVRYQSEEMMISVANIVGYDSLFSNSSNDNIFSSFDNFFGGLDGYHSRSDSLLNLTTDTAVTEISKSLVNDKMIVNEASKNKYVISLNGLHRFTILRSLYLVELARAKDSHEKEEVEKKYQIPVVVNKIDYLKTYCRFILSMFGYKNFELELDDNYKNTGKMEFTDINQEKRVLSDNELLQITIEALDNDKDLCQKIYINAEYDEELHTFLDSFCPGFIQKMKEGEFENVVQSSR